VLAQSTGTVWSSTELFLDCAKIIFYVIFGLALSLPHSCPNRDSRTAVLASSEIHLNVNRIAARLSVSTLLGTGRTRRCWLVPGAHWHASPPSVTYSSSRFTLKYNLTDLETDIKKKVSWLASYARSGNNAVIKSECRFNRCVNKQPSKQPRKQCCPNRGNRETFLRRDFAACLRCQG